MEEVNWWIRKLVDLRIGPGEINFVISGVNELMSG